MFASGSLRETREESRGISNIQSSNNICIGDLTEYLTIAESHLLFKVLVFGRRFGGSRQESKSTRRIRRHWYGVMTITFLGRRTFPAMCLENSLDVRLTGYLDVVTSLVHVDAIVSRANTTLGLDADALGFSRSMLVNNSNKLLSSSRRLGTNGEVVDLAANEHSSPSISPRYRLRS